MNMKLFLTVLSFSIISTNGQDSKQIVPIGHRRIQSDTTILHTHTYQNGYNALQDSPPLRHNILPSYDGTADQVSVNSLQTLDEIIIQERRSDSTPLVETQSEEGKGSFFKRHKKTMWRMLWGATGLTIASLAVHGAMIVHNSVTDAAMQCDLATKNCANSASICNGVLSSLGAEAQIALNYLQSIIGESGQAQYYIQMLAQNITSLMGNINSLEEQSSILVTQNQYLQNQLAQCQAQCPPHNPLFQQ